MPRGGSIAVLSSAVMRARALLLASLLALLLAFPVGVAAQPCNETLAQLFERVSPAVVSIQATKINKIKPQRRFETIVGSGVIIEREGQIVAYQVTSSNGMYAHHAPMPGGFYTNYAIDSPDVPVFRDDEGELDQILPFIALQYRPERSLSHLFHLPTFSIVRVHVYVLRASRWPFMDHSREAPQPRALPIASPARGCRRQSRIQGLT